MKATPLERFMAKIEKVESGCWIWKAFIDRDGYGLFSKSHRQSVMAHRFSHEAHTGPIPDGFQIDHLCRVRACVNLAHLEAVTPHENWLRGFNQPAINARKTHCKNGHAFDETNTRHSRRNGNPSRSCAACRRPYEREWMRRHRAERKLVIGFLALVHPS